MHSFVCLLCNQRVGFGYLILLLTGEMCFVFRRSSLQSGSMSGNPNPVAPIAKPDSSSSPNANNMRQVCLCAITYTF